MFFNFNKFFNHYTYYQNFNYYYKLNTNNNDMANADLLIKNNNFKNFKKILCEIIEMCDGKNEKGIQQLKGDGIEMPISDRIKKLEIIDKNHFFAYFYDSVKLLFLNEEKNLSILPNTRIDFDYSIQSVTVSIIKNKISFSKINSLSNFLFLLLKLFIYLLFEYFRYKGGLI